MGRWSYDAIQFNEKSSFWSSQQTICLVHLFTKEWLDFKDCCKTFLSQWRMEIRLFVPSDGITHIRAIFLFYHVFKSQLIFIFEEIKRHGHFNILAITKMELLLATFGGGGWEAFGLWRRVIGVIPFGLFVAVGGGGRGFEWPLASEENIILNRPVFFSVYSPKW